MCGIAGILDWTTPPDQSILAEMTSALAHRGPDATGLVSHPPIAMGHRRLAVIDLSVNANQPMTDESGKFWIVFNGEIYNFRDVRQELVSQGARFHTASDTEVILEAYKRWDVECLQRLNGMFALALWDGVRQRLMLARDRAGEKPLYYCHWPGGLAFASELNSLRRHPAVSKDVAPAALGQYLAVNYVVGSDCLLKGVRRLEAAHYVLIDRDGVRPPVQYWDLAESFRTKRVFRSEAEAAEALTAQLDRAVGLRLVSDVPLGGFLSGGIDSSSIVASMCRAGNADQAQTFSVGFGEATYSELEWARFAARSLGLARHHEQVVSADVVATLPQIVRAADEPMADTSIIPMYFLAKLARAHVTVCLSGDGGDETLGGYETYLADKLHRYTQHVPKALYGFAAVLAERLIPTTFDKVSLDYKLRQFLSGHGLPPARAHYSWRTIFTDDERRALVRREHHDDVLGPDPFASFGRHFEVVKDCHYLDQAMYVDIKTWLADDILVKVDRMTMAHSLESRAPMLDHQFMEFAASLAPDLKIRGRTTKFLLKRSQADRLPNQIIGRTKRGLNAPVSHWFAGAAADLGREATSDRVLGEWIEPGMVRRLWDEHQSRRHDHGFKLFGLTCLGLWLRQPA